MLKKSFLFVFLMALLFPVFVFAQNISDNKLPTIYLYHSKDCPHCREEIKFLENLEKEIPGLGVQEFEVAYNKENQEKFLEVTKRFNINPPVVPVTIIGNDYLVGFDKPENSGEKIRQMLNLETRSLSDKESVSVPFFGEVSIKNFSLPVLSVILGSLDGFNPCSMWALLVLLTLLIATGSRKKVWLIGSVFILTSAISYFLFMSAWLNAFVFAGYLVTVRIIVGFIAIIAGVISIKEFYTFKPNVCEISTPEDQKKITEKIKKILRPENSLTAIILGVMTVAFSVNLIELMCSLGLPVLFTKTLTMYNLAAWKYYAYILLYVFFYMLDDIIVLVIAGVSMKFFHPDSKYSKWSRLIGGLLMLALGLIFLFKPNLLMF